jgi:hypothetical protein
MHSRYGFSQTLFFRSFGKALIKQRQQLSALVASDSLYSSERLETGLLRYPFRLHSSGRLSFYLVIVTWSFIVEKLGPLRVLVSWGSSRACCRTKVSRMQ